MYSNKASKGRVDQEYAKIGFKTVSLLKFCTLHDIAYDAHFPLSRSYFTSSERLIALKTFPIAIRGIRYLERRSQNAIWPREHLQLAEIRKCPSSCQSRRHVMRNGLRSPIQLWKMMGNMSNESSNSALKDAHTHYWAQIPYWWRI